MSLPGPQDQWDKVYYIFGSNDFNIRVWGSFLVSFLTFLGIGGLFTFVDLTGRPQCMSKYKVQDGVKSYPVLFISYKVNDAGIILFCEFPDIQDPALRCYQSYCYKSALSYSLVNVNILL
jgi:hypothetical protein